MLLATSSTDNLLVLIVKSDLAYMSDLSDLNWIISGKLDCINFGLKDFSFSPSEFLFFNLLMIISTEASKVSTYPELFIISKFESLTGNPPPVDIMQLFSLDNFNSNSDSLSLNHSSPFFSKI